MSRTRLAVAAGGVVTAMALFVLGGVWLMGWPEDGFTVTYENRMGVDLWIFIDGDPAVQVPANVTRDVAVYGSLWEGRSLVEARDGAGRVRFAAELSRGELADLDYHIVVADPGTEEGEPRARAETSGPARTSSMGIRTLNTTRRGSPGSV